MRARGAYALQSLRAAASSTSRVVEVITVVVGGSVIAAIVFGLQRPGIGLAVLIVAVSTAALEGAFRLSREATVRMSELEASLAAQMHDADFRDRLAGFLHEANELRVQLEAAIASRVTIDQTFVCHQMDEWGGRVQAYLAEHSSYLIPLWRREPDEGMPPRFPESAYYERWIVNRIGRLEAFIGRLD